MYTKDKVAHINLRLNAKQFDFVKSSAEDLGVSKSDFVRLLLNSSIVSSKPNDKQVKGK